jgi:LPS-assembly protein
MNPNGHLGVDWRWDYDPLRGKFTDSTLSADFRWGRYFISAGHTSVRSDPILSPNSNQFRTQLGWGNSERRGWNASAVGIYDFRKRPEDNRRVGLQYANATLTYNTDCCGFSLQWRRLNFGTRQENQFRIAFAVANLGSFGTLKKQERLF